MYNNVKFTYKAKGIKKMAVHSNNDAKKAVCLCCGLEVPAGSEKCPFCGGEIAPVSEAVNEEPSKKRSLVLIGMGAAFAVLVVLVIALFVFGLNKSSTDNYVLFIKDKEIFFSDLKSKKPGKTTSNLFNGMNVANDDIDESKYLIGDLCMLSKNGKYLFFPDKVGDSGNGFPLYCKIIKKSKSKAVMIDFDITCYHVSDDSSLVTYTAYKDGENVLYQYNMKNNTRSKIDSNVKRFKASDDGKRIVYIGSERSLHIRLYGEKAIQIAGDVKEFYTADSFKTVFYVTDNALYKKEEGKDPLLLSSDVYSVLKVYDSGEVYCIKHSDAIKLFLSKYVIDDMESDEFITKPIEPSVPLRSDYSTDQEYNKAFANYEKAMEEFNKKYAEYIEKSKRDSLRNDIARAIHVLSFDTLCYYDKDGNETIISDSCTSANMTAGDSPLVIYSAYTDSFEQIKLSSLDTYTTYNVELEILSQSTKWYAAMGGKSFTIDQKTLNSESIVIDSDSNTVYFVDNAPYYKDSGDMYMLTFSEGGALIPKLYDRDVYIKDITAFGGQVMYYKNYNDRMGELYLNKILIDSNIEVYNNINVCRVKYDKELKIIAYTVYNDSGSLELKVYKNGKTAEVSDNVYDFEVLPNGNVIYLCNFDTKEYMGDMYLYQNKKSRLISSGVICIIPYTDDRYRGLYLDTMR